MRSPQFDHYKTRRCTLTGKIEIFHPSHSVTKHSDRVCSRLIGMCSIITSLLIHCYISHSNILTVRFRYSMVTFPPDTYSTCVAHSGRRCVYLCGVYGFKVWQSMLYFFSAIIYTKEWYIRSGNLRNRLHWCYRWYFICLLVSCVVDFLSYLRSTRPYIHVYIYI